MIVDRRTVSSLSFNWDAPVSGEVTAYTIELLGVLMTKRTVGSGENRSTTFDNLMAGREYTVVVVAISGDVSSSNQEKRAYTSMFNALVKSTQIM